MLGHAVFFLLNTVGSLFALDLRETLIFTPITLPAALLAWRVAVGGTRSQKDRSPVEKTAGSRSLLSRTKRPP